MMLERWHHIGMDGLAYFFALTSPLFIWLAIRVSRLREAKGKNSFISVTLILLPSLIGIIAICYMRSPQYFWQELAPPKIEEMQVFFNKYQEELNGIVEEINHLDSRDTLYILYYKDQFQNDSLDIPDEVANILENMDIPQDLDVTITSDYISISNESDGPVRLYLIYNFYQDTFSEIGNDWYRVIDLEDGWYLEVLKFH